MNSFEDVKKQLVIVALSELSLTTFIQNLKI